MTARPAAEIAADRKSAVDGLAQLERAARVQVALRGSTIARLEKEVAEWRRIAAALVLVHGRTVLMPSDFVKVEAVIPTHHEEGKNLVLDIRFREPVT